MKSNVLRICYKILRVILKLLAIKRTALLFAKMEREEELVLNPYYERMVTGKTENSGFTLGSLFAGLDLQELALV